MNKIEQMVEQLKFAKQRRVIAEIRQFALYTTPARQDTKFNRGREDCINENPWSDDANYFLMCSGYGRTEETKWLHLR